MDYNFKITDLFYSQKNLIPSSLCQELINLFEKHKKLSVHETSYKYNLKKDTTDNYSCLNLNENIHIPEIKEYAIKIFDYIKIILFAYEKHIQESGICKNFNVKHINKTKNIRILKYSEGAAIGPHTDHDDKVRASLSIQLNDEYEGGSLKFFGRVRKPLLKGEGLIFPAEPIWIHETEPVTKGHRYVMNCFLYTD